MKKLLGVCFIAVSLFLASATTVFAGDATYTTGKDNADCLDAYRFPPHDVSSCVHVFNVKDTDLLYLAGRIGDPRVLTNDLGLQKKLYQDSAMGKVTQSIAFLYAAPPADTRQFIAYYGNKIGIKPAYAQGIGFSGLSPLLPLWRAFRNVAYGFLILIMVAVGFMVLFRMKIDPRTVISVQNAIPRIIVTLILITFSYAIVGLLIDVMYLVIFLGITTLHSAVGFPKFQETVVNYTGGSLPNLWGAVFTPGSTAVDDISRAIGGGTPGLISSVVLGVLSGLIFGGVPGIIIGTAVTAGGAALGIAKDINPLVWALVMLALLFTFIRILFTLINAYIQIIIALIFGPLQLMFGAIPNSNASSSWFRGLIANLAVFPVTTVMLLMGLILSDIANKFTYLWTPPGLTGGLSGTVGGNISSGIGGIIGIGFVFMIPNVANSLKELLKAKPVIPGGTGAVFAPITSVYGTAMGGISQAYYFKMLGLDKAIGRLTGRGRGTPPSG